MDFIDKIYKDKYLLLLKKLTLVIPTYNRNYYLSRCLWYHAHFPFGQIIVADSSPEEKKIINRQTVEKVREKFGSNILYLEYPPETEKWGGDIYRKWGDAVNHVKTEYSKICTDKEFTIPTTQCKCIEFLDSHNDYSLANGMHYNILRSFGTLKIIDWQSRMSIDYDSIKDRLNFVITSKEVFYLLFGVLKSQTLKKIYGAHQKYNINEMRFGEICSETLPIIYGKIMTFPDMPGNLRDSTNVYHHVNANNAESSSLRYPSRYEYPSELYNTSFQNAKKCFHDEIYDVSRIDIDDDILNQLLPAAKIGYQNKLLKKHKSLNDIWECLPYSLKYITSKKFGEGRVQKTLPLKKITPEIKVVMKTINKFNKYHDTDTPIVDVYIQSNK